MTPYFTIWAQSVIAFLRQAAIICVKILITRAMYTTFLDMVLEPSIRARRESLGIHNAEDGKCLIIQDKAPQHRDRRFLPQRQQFEERMSTRATSMAIFRIVADSMIYASLPSRRSGRRAVLSSKKTSFGASQDDEFSCRAMRRVFLSYAKTSLPVEHVYKFPCQARIITFILSHKKTCLT